MVPSRRDPRCWSLALGSTSPWPTFHHAIGHRARDTDAARHGRSTAGRCNPAGLAQLAAAAKCGAGVSGGGEDLHGTGLGPMRGRHASVWVIAALTATSGCASSGAKPAAVAPDQTTAVSTPGLVSTDQLARWQRELSVSVVDVRPDVFTYLKGHLPDAAYLNIETLRATDGGSGPALVGPCLQRALLPARTEIRPAGGDLQRRRDPQHRRDLSGLAPGRVRPSAGVRPQRRLLQVGAGAAAGGAAISPDQPSYLPVRSFYSGASFARGGAPGRRHP